MEERVHSNGSRDGGDTATSGGTVGSGPATSGEASEVGTIANKTFCTDHGKQMWECFYEHHQPVDREMVKLHLPCGHLCNRPTKGVARVTCDSGEHEYDMKYDVSNTAWNAVRVSGQS